MEKDIRVKYPFKSITTINKQEQKEKHVNKINTSNKKGFTLVELLVVLVVIGILIALIVPNTLRAIRQANIRENAANIRSINTALQLCYAQNRSWANCDTPADLTAAGANGQFLTNYPVDPLNGSAYVIAGNAANGYSVTVGTHVIR